MSRLVWPEVNTAKPYNLSNVHPVARPHSHPPVTPEHISWDAHHPRKCLGLKHALPDGFIYWCLSCNRRVENANQPFCTRHREQRAKHMRRVRAAHNKPVKVPRDVIQHLHKMRGALEDDKFHLNQATTPRQRKDAWLALQHRIDALALYLHQTLPYSDSGFGRYPVTAEHEPD